MCSEAAPLGKRPRGDFDLSGSVEQTKSHVVVSKKNFSNDALLSRVREYLPMDALVRETDVDGNATGDEAPRAFAPNTFYVFDAEALGAFCHGIEDLALEAANGSLLAAFQTFENFKAHRERYCHLAVTVDSVEVLGAGPVRCEPSRIGWDHPRRRSDRDQIPRC